MSYPDHATPTYRWEILDLLERAPDYSHNEGIIRSGLHARGHKLSSDRIRTELSWLAEQGLISVEDPCGGLQVARLTRRGEDVALGHARIPGVARPRPGE